MNTILSFVAAVLAGALLEWLLSLILPKNPTPRHILSISLMALIFVGVVAWTNDTNTALVSQGDIRTIDSPTAVAATATPSLPNTDTLTPIPTDTTIPTTVPVNPTNTRSVSTPTITPIVATKTPRPTNTPIDSGNDGVTIELHGSSGDLPNSDNVQVQILAAHIPVVGQSFSVGVAEKDIAGNWTTSKLIQDSRNLNLVPKTDQNGVFTISLPSGQYTLCPSGGGSPKMNGTWGVKGKCYSRWDNNNYEKEIIVFPVVAGKTTYISLSLALLEVGVISEDKALSGAKVTGYSQSIDIAGNKVREDQQFFNTTDNKGLMQVAVGAGIYMMEISAWRTGDVIYDVLLNPGESKQIIIPLPPAQNGPIVVPLGN